MCEKSHYRITTLDRGNISRGVDSNDRSTIAASIARLKRRNSEVVKKLFLNLVTRKLPNLYAYISMGISPW